LRRTQTIKQLGDETWTEVARKEETDLFLY